jgi:hypothetical protein
VLRGVERAALRLRELRSRLALGLLAASAAVAAGALAPLPARAALPLATAGLCGVIWAITLLAAPGLLLGPRTRAAWTVNALGVLAALLAPFLLAAIVLA